MIEAVLDPVEAVGIDGEHTDGDIIAPAASALEGAPPEETLGWAVEQYADRLTFATGFGPEGCVLIDLIGRHALPIDIFTLDTGLIFEETRDLWRRLEARYGLRIRGVKPALTVDEQTAVHGGQLWEHAPNHCCAIRKVAPLREELANVDAWITAIRRDQTPERANARTVDWDDKFGIAKVNPLVTWTSADVWRYLAQQRRALQPAARPGLPQHRLLALHHVGRAGRERTGGALARHDEDRVRPPCGTGARDLPGGPVIQESESQCLSSRRS